MATASNIAKDDGFHGVIIDDINCELLSKRWWPIAIPISLVLYVAVAPLDVIAESLRIVFSEGVDWWRLILTMIVVGICLTLITGLLHVIVMQYSVSLHEDGLRYVSRFRRVTIPWASIVRIQATSLVLHVETKDRVTAFSRIPYRDSDAFLECLLVHFKSSNQPQSVKTGLEQSESA